MMAPTSLLTACPCGHPEHGRISTYRTAYGNALITPCLRCGLARDLVDHNGGYPYNSEGSVYVPTTAEDFRARVATSQPYVDFIKVHVTRPGTALEVGCNSGYFLHALKVAGWDAVGVEANAPCAEYARVRGLDVINSTFELAELAAESFDLVAISHTLEHLPDPHDAVLRAWDVLRRGGLLFVAVPNYGSLLARLLPASRASLFLPGQHLYYFSKKTLVDMCGRAGFEPLAVTTGVTMGTGSRLPLGRPVKRLLRSAMRYADAGEEIVALFRKPSSV